MDSMTDDMNRVYTQFGATTTQEGWDLVNSGINLQTTEKIASHGTNVDINNQDLLGDGDQSEVRNPTHAQYLRDLFVQGGKFSMFNSCILYSREYILLMCDFSLYLTLSFFRLNIFVLYRALSYLALSHRSKRTRWSTSRTTHLQPRIHATQIRTCMSYWQSS